jgi:hypothetical protein
MDEVMWRSLAFCSPLLDEKFSFLSAEMHGFDDENSFKPPNQALYAVHDTFTSTNIKPRVRCGLFTSCFCFSVRMRFKTLRKIVFYVLGQPGQSSLNA